MSQLRALLFGVIIAAALLQAQVPSFTSASFRNAASFDSTSAVALGEIVTIFGTNLSTSTQTIPIGSHNPTQIPGSQTRVFFGNIPAPLLYVSPTLVNVQVPYDLPQALCTVDVTVRNELGTSAPVMIGLALQDPGVFAALISSAFDPGVVGVYRLKVTVPAGVSGTNINVKVTKSPATSCGR
jgi:IPT/TIG domain